MSNQHVKQTTAGSENPSSQGSLSTSIQHMSHAQAERKANRDQEELNRLQEQEVKDARLQEEQNHILDQIVACFDILPPFKLLGSNQSPITVNTGLKEAIVKMQNEHPDFVLDGFDFPVSIQFADGTKGVISDKNQFENLVQECIGE